MLLRAFSLVVIVKLLISPAVWAGNLEHGWSQRFGDASGQYAGGVAVDDSGNVIVVGHFRDTVDFGGGTLTSAGSYDIYVVKFDAAGTHLWSERFGDASGQYARDVAVDDSGNVIVVGHFWGTVDFGGGTLTSAGRSDFFVAKFDAAGTHLWSERFGDVYQQFPGCVAVDDSGNVIVVGYFEGIVDFGGGELTSAGSYDIYVAKFDAAGIHLWSERFGDAGTQYAVGVAVDGSANVIVVGHFWGTVDFGGGTLTSAGNSDIYAAKFDAAGTHLSSERFGDAGIQLAEGVAVDGLGNVIVVGSFHGTVDFGGGTLTSAGNKDIYVVKFDAAGTHLWSQRFGDASAQYAHGVVVDDSGNVIVVGNFGGTVDFGGGTLTSAGNSDIFVAKFDAAGTHLWSERFGDTDEQLGLGVAVDGSGNVFMVGSFHGTVDFGGGTLTSAGNSDIFVAKFGGTTSVNLDIHPRSCPNPFNIKWLENMNNGNGNGKGMMMKGGVMPAALVGSESFDVTDIDVSTLLLNGVQPLRDSFGDVTRPADGGECACTTEGPDGFTDLTLKFSRQAIAGTFGTVADGDVVTLTIAGSMLDGTPFEASDCVTILSRGPEPPVFSGRDQVVLYPAVPNPFNPVTQIRYALPREDFVKLTVYDVTGRVVERLVRQIRPPGEHVVTWDARRMPSGVYFYRLKVGSVTQTNRFILLK